jgi:alpha-D-ribose 1-methylphosphonate 5-triphosphate synthase subunit PhnH
MQRAKAFIHWGQSPEDPSWGSQHTFRAIFEAMENPGQLITVRHNPYAPEVFNSAAAATWLTLLENDTCLWTDIDWKNPAIDWLQIGCGSSIVTEPCMANFAIVTQPATMPPLDSFRVGRHEYLEKATTMLIQVDDILPTTDNTYSTIAVNKTDRLVLKGVPDPFWYQWRQLSRRYPLGIDIIFTCDDVLMALPKIKE